MFILILLRDGLTQFYPKAGPSLISQNKKEDRGLALPSIWIVLDYSASAAGAASSKSTISVR